MENTNTQTKEQSALDEKPKKAEETTQPTVQAVPAKKTYKCLVCGKSYSKKTSLFTHHKTHPEHCVHCGEKRGSSVENIYEHNLKHINLRPFVCKVCGESFLRNQQFTEHEKSHLEKKDDKDTPAVTREKENKYKCKECENSFTNWKLFYKHQQETGHFNEKFLCEICGSEFLSNLLLSQHIRRLHKRTDETFPCTSCSKVFASKPNLDSHIKKMHQNDNAKTHRCETCNNVFSSAPNLKQHIKTVHEVEKEFECQTCKKPFKAKNRLTRHEKEVHMGKNGNADEVRMYNCDHCKKKYKRSWHQVRHNQMKHENSNTSTATSSGTPPTPEIINGNLNLPSANNTINNNNVNSFHQTIHQPLSNSPQQMPSTTPQHQTTNQHIQEPMSQDISNIAAQSAQTIIPPIVHQHQSQPQSQPQTIWNNHQISPHSVHNSPQQAHHQTHLGYGSDMMDTSKNYVAPPPINNGQYVHYDMNDQYSGMQNPAPQQVSYDSWQQPQQQQQWDYGNQHIQQQPSMYQHQSQQQSAASDWSSYYDPNGMYNNSYSCLNQQQTAPIQQQQQPSADPSLYNGVQNSYYYYPPQVPDPYINQQQAGYTSNASVNLHHQAHSNNYPM